VVDTRPRQRWLVPVLLLAMVATLVGAVLSRNLYAEPEPPAPPAVLPTQTSVPSAEQPGPATVAGTEDALSHPLYGTVRPLLQTFFDAINAKDYDLWRTTVTDERVRVTPEDTWQNDFQSTQDGSPVVYRIELRDKNAARVLLTFTSTQDVEYAPPELPEPCIHWNVVYPLQFEDGQWRIGTGTTSSTPQMSKC
jgi:hypothetical protein